jgi:hypothetical protein
MSLDAATKRRCAAYAVFSPVLSEDAVIDTLWHLHTALRGETARDIIAAVDQVAQRQSLDARTCKRLYEGFYRALHLPDHELPLDPWPVMQAMRPDLAAAAAPIVPVRPAGAWTPPPGMAPTAWAPAATAVAAALSSMPPAPYLTADMAPPLAPAPALPPAPTGPAHVQVFAALMQAALSEVRQQHPTDLDDLRASAIAGLDGSPLSGPLRNQVRQAWQNLDAADWHFDLNPRGLAELVHGFYVALCETLGPVDADHVLTHAVKRAEAVPAARQHSPKLFL